MHPATAPAGITALADDARLIFGAALAAVDPRRAVAHALAFVNIPAGARIWILAVGKAAPAMTAGALDALAALGREPAGGVVIGTLPDPVPPHAALQAFAGDHPVPGARSLAAAGAVDALVRRVAPRDVTWVLLSGGASSLIAAPVAGIAPDDLASLYRQLLGSGLAIGDVNRIRKRVSRWGGGRLARALEPAMTRVLAISDVPGDDPAAIGSGPLAPDECSLDEVRALLARAGLAGRLPASVRQALAEPPEDGALETLGPADPAFRHVSTEIIASNDLAVRAAIARARTLGYDARRASVVLEGDAATAGRALARELLDDRRNAGAPRCLVSGGETTVRLDDAAPGARGGRSQELALAAAGQLAGRPDDSVVLLAAGTDGRDGPTDAAGAIVHPGTWEAIRRAGRDPERDLQAHDSASALESADALLRTGPTGTNVMDLAIALAH